MNATHAERIAAALERIAAALEAPTAPRQAQHRPITPGRMCGDAITLFQKHLTGRSGQEFTMDEIMDLCGITDRSIGMRKSLGWALGDYGARQRKTNKQRFYIMP